MAHITVNQRSIEYQWFEPSTRRAASPIVMLHEGLGSVALWKDFPQQLADACKRRVLAYSRYGYGQSERLVGKREPNYMHDEALIVLPALREQLELINPVLFGHSDGASIALIHAAANRWSVSAVIALAPHVFVEDFGLRSIMAAREAYLTTDLKQRLARYHADPDSAFWGWNDIWLDPRFRDWNIETFLPNIQCPVLAVQGYDDEYGSMEQIHRILRAADLVEVLKLKQCGHSPHRDAPESLLKAVQLVAGSDQVR